MATVTPNYSWPVPTSTDLVKDGATAIEALGDAIDATVNGLGVPGITLVKSQVIGTAVASVNVTAAFSTSYDVYKIVINGGSASANANLQLSLGGTTTGYYWGNQLRDYTGVSGNLQGSNTANFTRVGYGTGNTLFLNADILNPFLAKNTLINYQYVLPLTSGNQGDGNGFLNDSTSYTDFTITPLSGTLTGGTIYVYGYKK